MYNVTSNLIGFLYRVLVDMQITNTEKKYGAVHKLVHWVMAIMIIGLIAVGLYMGEMDPSPEKWQAYALHKSFGISIIALVGVRILWKLVNASPKLPEGMKSHEKALAHLGHLALYVMMLAMPFSGWIMSSAGGHAVKFFDWTVPAIVEKGSSLGHWAHEIHEIGGSLFIALIVLHVVAALYHHYIRKDDVLKRMV